MHISLGERLVFSRLCSRCIVSVTYRQRDDETEWKERETQKHREKESNYLRIDIDAGPS